MRSIKLSELKYSCGCVKVVIDSLLLTLAEGKLRREIKYKVQNNIKIVYYSPPDGDSNKARAAKSIFPEVSEMGGRSVLICEGAFLPRSPEPKRFALLFELVRLKEAKLPTAPPPACWVPWLLSAAVFL